MILLYKIIKSNKRFIIPNISTYVKESKGSKYQNSRMIHNR